MSAPPTIPEALASAAAEDNRGYTFVGDDGRTEHHHSFASLYEQAARRAGALQRCGLRPGDPVALVLSDGEDFALTMLGALLARVVPVPIVPPFNLGRLGAWLEHCRHILARCGATVLVTDPAIRRVAGTLASGPLRRILLASDLALGEAPTLLRPPRPDEPAFIQFTSGSTAQPKGVLLTHGNLAANAHCIMRLGLRATPEDSGCTWLPFYHDMGLIGFVLAPLTTSTPVVFMPPLLFLKRPVEWLRLMTRHRGTIGFGPSFAYGLCASRVRDRDLEGLDLRSWRVAGCGAEPVHAPTLERFAERFAPVGFDRRALMPCYGIAESTLAVTFAPLGRPLVTDRVRLDALSYDREAVPCSPEDEGTVLVSCGRPFDGHDLAVVDPSGAPLRDREVGEVALRGPSVAAGYHGAPAATAQTFRGGWLHTGDLGYLADGELFVCGRIKDLIIVGGRNYYPTDVEWAAAEVPGVRTGNVVAFGLPAPGGGSERVVLCAETREPPGRFDALERAVRGHVMEATGLHLDVVLLLAPGTLPKTSSGKLQRQKTRERYLQADLAAAAHPEGRVQLFAHLARSQWQLLRQRLRSPREQGDAR